MFCLICVFSCLPRLSGSPTLNPWSEVICENNDVLDKEREIILSHRSMCWSNRGRSRGREQGVCTPPEMTCGFLIQLVFCKKKTMWFIGLEVEQETSAPPPKKNPRSAPE